jgi:hypothetical protein
MDIRKDYYGGELVAGSPDEMREVEHLINEIMRVFARNDTRYELLSPVAVNLMTYVMRRPGETPAVVANRCSRLFGAIAKRMAS